MYVTSWIAFFGLLMLDFGLPSVFAAIPTTKAKLNEAATVYCNESCSGVIGWHRGDLQVAACGPGAESQLEYNCQINEGKSSVIIPQVNYSTRGFYWVSCDDKEIIQCRQLLQPHPVESAIELEAGDYVRLDLHTSEPVIVLFMKFVNSSAGQICFVDKRVRRCMTEYEQRVHIIDNSVVLMNVTSSDSGSYAVQEKDGILVSTLNVTVIDIRRSSTWTDEYKKGFWLAALCFGIGGLFAGLCLGMCGFPRVCFWVHWCVHRLRRTDSIPTARPEENMENGLPLMKVPNEG